MKIHKTHPVVIVALMCGLLLGATACGDDPETSDGAATTSAEPADAGASDDGGQSCPDVEAETHIDTEVMVSGTECDAVTDVILGAEGEGRKAYESGGFACEPKDREDGSTDYTCEADEGVSVTFNHMAA